MLTSRNADQPDERRAELLRGEAQGGKACVPSGEDIKVEGQRDGATLGAHKGVRAGIENPPLDTASMEAPRDRGLRHVAEVPLTANIL
jgi:hypothetical protein